MSSEPGLAAFELLPPHLDYSKIGNLAGAALPDANSQRQRISPEALKALANAGQNGDTIFTFTILFEPDQTKFSPDKYGPDFERMIETASTFGHAAVIVRGHSDPTRTLADFVKGGMAKGILTRTGNAPNYTYQLDGKPFDLAKTDEVLKAIESGLFDGSNPNPRENAQAAETLSLERATAVKRALLEFAKSKGANLDESQILPVGIGIREPRVARPKDIEEAKQNTRVEFRVVRVAAEALKQSDFDF